MAWISFVRELVRRPLTWLIVCVLLSFFVLVYPMYVIRPFRYQGPRELSLALAVVRFRPFLEVVFIVASIALLVLAWRKGRSVWGRAAASLCVLLVVGFGVLSRVNVYELMFHPIGKPTFSAASRAKLAGAEMVIAVRIDGEARAYPIRSISYHHIVNDVVGGLPIVATY
jgi:phosphoglycerol transferase MdoB-like AlkP superfamily enzyme